MSQIPASPGRMGEQLTQVNDRLQKMDIQGDIHEITKD